MATLFTKFRQELERAVRKVTSVDAWPATIVRAGTVPARSVVKFTNGLELEVLNFRFSSVENLKVRVGFDPLLPGVLQVLGIRENINLIGQASSWSFWVPEHHENHEFPNPDTVWVHGAQFVPLNVTSSGLTITINGSVLWGGSDWVGFQSETEDMTARVPSAGARFVLVEVDSDGTLEFTDGSTKATRNLLVFSDIPAPTPGRRNVCAIRLYDGQTTIYYDVRVGKPNDVIDLRWSGYSTGGLANDLTISDLDVEASPTSGDKLAIDRSGVRKQIDWDDLPSGGGAAWSDIDSAAADTPLDADKFGFWDVVDSALKSITWANIKATLKTYFDTLYQAVDATLTSISALGTDAGKMLYTTGVDTWAETPITGAGRALLDDASAAAQLVTLGATPSTGWNEISDTWTRTGDHTYTVASDVTATYGRKNTKIRCKQGGDYIFGVVESSSYSAPDTTINLIVNTDYTLAADAITNTAVSFIENPEGFPSYFNYTPETGAVSPMTYESVTVTFAYWKPIGNAIMTMLSVTGTTGGTASAGITATLAYTQAVQLNGYGRVIDSTIAAATVTSSSVTRIAIRKYDNSVYGLGSGRSYVVTHIGLL